MKISIEKIALIPRFSERIFILIGTFSISAAIIFYMIGGSIAEVTGEDNTIIGISFRASGAIAGFIITLYISTKIIEKLEMISQITKDMVMHMKLYLVGKPKNFNRQHKYICKYCTFNEETGIKKNFETDYRWEAGYLTLDLRDIDQYDLIKIFVEDANKDLWECDYFHPYEPKVEVNLVTNLITEKEDEYDYKN